MKSVIIVKKKICEWKFGEFFNITLLRMYRSWEWWYLQDRVLWDWDLPMTRLGVRGLSFPTRHPLRYPLFSSVPPSNVRSSSTWLDDFETTPVKFKFNSLFSISHSIWILESSRFQSLKNLFDEIYYPILCIDNIPIIDRKQKEDSASISTSGESVTTFIKIKWKVQKKKKKEKKKKK